MKGSTFHDDAAAICRAPLPAYYFDNSVRPLQTATGPGFRGTAEQLRNAMDARARSGGGTVWLARAAVIYVGNHRKPGPVRLAVPAGVELATVGRPGPRSYEKMARLVRTGDTCLYGSFCKQAVLTVDGGRNAARLADEFSRSGSTPVAATRSQHVRRASPPPNSRAVRTRRSSTVASTLRCRIRVAGPTSSVFKAREITSACPARICRQSATSHRVQHRPLPLGALGRRHRR